MTDSREPRGPHDASMLKVLNADEAVRKRPTMYFGGQQDDADLPAGVLHVALSQVRHDWWRQRLESATHSHAW